ncbi:MAG TPA: presqualene diphosphate synthase HpnD [Chloroflexota bacterium]|nr:presqualene diphosphate synthase HpnD [Chloroflexota bacterium]
MPSKLPRLDDEVLEAYDYCRDVTRREAKNWYYGFISLPPEKRRAIYAAYAFSRECDDDSDADGSVESKRAAIARTRERLEAAYTGLTDDPILLALGDAARRYDIPSRYFDELIAGVEMDLDLSRYPTFEELRVYCYRVASVVGLICLQIFGYSDPRAPELGADLGLALQLTNIMRDVKEDAERGRIYIPQDEIRRFGYSEEELLAGVYNEPFRRLMAFQAERAWHFHRRGAQLLPLLDVRARACTATMQGIYREILQRIQAAGYVVFDGRVSLSGRDKLGLTAGAWLQSLRDELGHKVARR